MPGSNKPDPTPFFLLPKQMNILYLADPRSPHDLKDISYFSKQGLAQSYLICRKSHWAELRPETLQSLESQHSFKFLGHIDDYSVARPGKTHATAKWIQQLIRTYHIDLFHIFFAEPNALWASFRKRFKIPIVVTTRGSDALIGIPHAANRKSQFGRIVFKRYQQALRQTDQIISNSQSQIDQLNTCVNGLKPILLIRDGIHVQKMNGQVYSFPSPPPKVPYILFPRNMAPIYNHELALDAISKLPATILETYQFVFLKSDAPYLSYVKKIRQKMDQIGQARFLFYPSLKQEELFALYQQASLVIMTLTSDGSSVAAMEAMYFKTPLVLPPLPYDQDLFGEVPSFSTWEASELAQLMEELLKKPEKAQVEKNALLVREKADKAKEMDRVMKVYSTLIRKN